MIVKNWKHLKTLPTGRQTKCDGLVQWNDIQQRESVNERQLCTPAQLPQNHNEWKKAWGRIIVQHDTVYVV